MPRTKIVGYLIVAVAILDTAVDIFDGGSINIASHINDISAALAGAGLVFLRDAISKIEILKK